MFFALLFQCVDNKRDKVLRRHGSYKLIVWMRCKIQFWLVDELFLFIYRISTELSLSTSNGRRRDGSSAWLHTKVVEEVAISRVLSRDLWLLPHYCRNKASSVKYHGIVFECDMQKKQVMTFDWPNPAPSQTPLKLVHIHGNTRTGSLIEAYHGGNIATESGFWHGIDAF